MAEKKKKSETRIAFEKKFKAERKKQGAGGTFMFRGKKYTTDYASEVKKKSKKKKESGAVEKSSPPLKRPKIKEYKYDYEPGQITETDLGKFDKNYKEAKPNVRTGPKTGEKAKKVPPKPKLRIYRDTIENQRERKAWEKKYGKDYNNDGTLKENKQTQKRGDRRNLSMGGMMPMDQQKKVNPTTGLSMNKGGMIDMRKTGMFYGGMTRKK